MFSRGEGVEGVFEIPQLTILGFFNYCVAIRCIIIFRPIMQTVMASSA